AEPADATEPIAPAAKLARSQPASPRSCRTAGTGGVVTVALSPGRVCRSLRQGKTYAPGSAAFRGDEPGVPANAGQRPRVTLYSNAKTATLTAPARFGRLPLHRKFPPGRFAGCGRNPRRLR